MARSVKYLLVSGSGVEATAEDDLSQSVEVTLAFDQRVDVLVVDVEGLGLDERVLVAMTSVGWMDVIDIGTAIDVHDMAVDVSSAQQIVVDEDFS